MERGPNVMRLVEGGLKYVIVKRYLAIAKESTVLEAPRKSNSVHWLHVRISIFSGILVCFIYFLKQFSEW